MKSSWLWSNIWNIVNLFANRKISKLLRNYYRKFPNWHHNLGFLSFSKKEKKKKGPYDYKSVLYHRLSLDPRCVCYVLSLLRFLFFFFFFFFTPFPQQAVLFMYGIWTVAAIFDQFFVNSTSVHCSWTHKFHFLSIFSLKMSLTVLFTHLKIILLQWFQQ